jgi:hypothetical protein
MVAVGIAVEGQVGMLEGVFCPKPQPRRDIAGQRALGIGEEGVVDTANVEGVDETGRIQEWIRGATLKGVDLVGLAIEGEVAEHGLAADLAGDHA